MNGGHDGDGGEDADGGQQQLSQSQPHPPRVQPLVAGADHAGLRRNNSKKWRLSSNNGI